MTENREPSRQAHVDAIADWFRTKLDQGERAALRRTRDPRREAAFWRVALARGLDQKSDQDQLAWAEVMRALSFLADRHLSGARLGTVLGCPPGAKAGGFTQLRFERLLSAQGSRLHDEVRAAVRFLDSKLPDEGKVDVADLAALLLLDADSEHGKENRRRIAQDYFAAVHRDEAATA